MSGKFSVHLWTVVSVLGTIALKAMDKFNWWAVFGIAALWGVVSLLGIAWDDRRRLAREQRLDRRNEAADRRRESLDQDRRIEQEHQARQLHPDIPTMPTPTQREALRAELFPEVILPTELSR